MTRVGRSSDEQLLLGEWACLGVLGPGPAHGFAIAARLKPSGDVGRVWSLSRPLTYRSLEQLRSRGYVEPVGEEPGIAGGNRTILSATPAGRELLREWLTVPVSHLRDIRSELMLKLVIGELCSVDQANMLGAQRALFAELFDTLDQQVTADPGDVVARWRREFASAALRFLDQLPDPPR